MAGESARTKATRQREQATRLLQSADRWEKGALGEVAVAQALAELDDSWTVLHDLRWPGRRYANIDHVVIGHGQVYVVDAKNWTGDVTATGGVLRQNGRSRRKEVTSAAEAAHAVAALVGLPLKSVRPVICLVRDEWFSEKFGEVTVCSLLNLVAFVRGSSAGPADEQLDTRRIIYALNNPGPPPQTSQRRSQLDAGATSAGRMRRFARASKLVVAMAIVGVMLLRPEWVTAAAERVGEELTSRFVITDTAGQPPPVQQPGSNEKRNNNRHRKHNEQQSSR